MSGDPTPSEQALADRPPEKLHPIGTDTVEAAVRRQLSRALGGRRGMVEAAAPTITFTFTYVSTKELRLAIGLSVSIVLVALVARVVQRSTVQYVFNALVGIGVGCFFVWLGARNGGDQSQQALAYFLPGLIYNAGYAVAMVLSILVRWPVVGLLVGAVSEDPTAWRQDSQIVKLCSRLTWVLVVPCILRVAVQLPIYLGGRAADNADGYVAALGVARVAMGWPLQLSALAVMVWLLARNRTPVSAEPAAPQDTQQDTPQVNAEG
jgi:hypothetical protein